MPRRLRFGITGAGKSSILQTHDWQQESALAIAKRLIFPNNGRQMRHQQNSGCLPVRTRMQSHSPHELERFRKLLKPRLRMCFQHLNPHPKAA